MIIVRIETPGGRYYGPDKLAPYTLLDAEKDGIEALVYDYNTGSYEGLGHALLRKNGNWAYADLGHCSCYGPLGSMPDLFEPLETLLGRMSEELREQVQPLVAALKERGLDLT